ncbi:uncharacterized protein LOC6558129 isoform X1 [Drosophila grimshawi]|uniref:uncharacterized protein LOC6558129 isoform X1 n=1 Tax=Drosophila grimshawi TaxID=7222 RepID=UPI001C93420B|nr:uncharacterized protein LOC6558129 isoform X1 [Drosophila grimshawi]
MRSRISSGTLCLAMQPLRIISIDWVNCCIVTPPQNPGNSISKPSNSSCQKLLLDERSQTDRRLMMYVVQCVGCGLHGALYNLGFAIPDFKNGKVVNRARGFVVRIFDAICNCANNNAAAATTRFKLRNNGGSASTAGGKRQQSQDEPETLVLSKKKPSADGKKKGKGVTMADDVEAGVRLVD